MSGNDKKVYDDKNDNKITIYIDSQDGQEQYIRVKRMKPLKKVLEHYCAEKKVEYGAMRFIYKNKRLPVMSTPDKLRMKSEARILAVVDSHSG